MKELSIKEKANAYDKAIETARKINSGEGVAAPSDWTICEVIFPELKESEDEKIRKELLEHCKNQAKPYIQTGNKCPQIQSWIAWLEKQGERSIYNVPSREEILAIWDLGNEWKELTKGSISTEYGTQLEYIQKHWQESEYYLRAKQGEQKSADKIESKFKVGDWIVSEVTGSIYQIKKCIENLSNHKYGYDIINGGYINTNEVNRYHLWTIQDAKDGDVLVHNGCTFIFMGIKDGIVQALEENLLDGTNPVPFGEPEYDKDYYPATKEQHDTLMKAMADAGYEWDAEKKELKKIEQKHAWSEEDERNLNDVILFIETGTYSLDKDNLINWLKSLIPQNRWKPSDEQMKALKEVIDVGYFTSYPNALETLYEQLSLLDTIKATGKQCKSYGYYLFDTPIEVCQCLANLRNKELINIIYAGKYVVFYAETVESFPRTSLETSNNLR